ncbi:MAG: redoxin domain-containing protein [Pirellulales bacterium]
MWNGNRAAVYFMPLFVLIVLAATACSRGEGAPSTAKSTAPATAELGEFPPESLQASGGSKVALPAERGRVATVIVCMSVECPISNEFLPAIQDLAESYRPKGVSFVGINPNGGESLEVMAAYAKQHELVFPFLKDDGGKISRRLLFNVTPEARVFDAAGEIVYRGRIDDRYRPGSGEPGATIKRDLADALDEVLAGKPVSQARTRTVGCPIQPAAPAAK